MLKSDLNINKTNNATKEEIHEILEEAYTAESDLRSQLSKIRINISGSKNPEVIKAVEAIFGKSYISSSGNCVLTYDMYCSTLNLLRSLGNSKAQEIL